MRQFTNVFHTFPASIQNLLQFVVTKILPDQMILFGSRARGDHRENSDFDIAITGTINPQKWTELLLDLEEKNLSLQSIDLVQLKDLSNDYKQNIKTEGKIIYG